MTTTPLVLLALLSALPARAQTVDGRVPNLNAQHFRPSIDARHTLWVDDAALSPKGWQIRLLGHYTRNPLVYVPDFGDEVPIVSDVFQTDLMGGGSVGPFRLGAYVPVYLVQSGARGSGAGLGDVGLDGKLRVLPHDSAVGLALAARVAFPTATVDNALGASGVVWEATGVVDAQAGPVLLALNAGFRGEPETEIENVTTGGLLVLRASAGVAIGDRAGVALEAAGGQSVAELGNPAALPIEGMLSGYGYVAGDLVVRAGVGTGLTRGIGSPDVRGVLGLGLEPRGERGPRDSDRDGVPDEIDACIDDPEDRDGVMDDDGCPEYAITLAVTDMDGQPLADATVSLTGLSGTQEVGAGQSVQLFRGAYRAEATAPEHTPRGAEIQVGNADGAVTLQLPPLPPPPVDLGPQLVVQGNIPFATNSDELLPEALPVLDSIVEQLAKLPDSKIRIDGHTDTRGSATYNQELSQRRAEAVERYLVEHGVDAARLDARGFGESQPLDPGDTLWAHDLNRRVEIYVATE